VIFFLFFSLWEREKKRNEAKRKRERSQSIVVQSLTAADWAAVARIYAAGIASGNATFEHEVPDWPEWSAARLAEPCLVARSGEEVVGWAALSPTSRRAVYRGVGAVSIYVDPAHAGRGVGKLLLGELIAASERAGLWTLEAGIFPENAASIALHQRCGFRLVGVRRCVGQMQDGRWRDVLLYERRSDSVGVEP
jgi:L-amino acid N-acyltransferase YncA